MTWLLVPLQAAIFASETIMKTANSSFALSTGYIPADKQNSTLGARYIHSSHGIIWLNETLPPYMSREYVLAPFQPQESGPQSNETWTASTILYSVDLNCEKPQVIVDKYGEKIFNTSIGCSYPVVPSRIGNMTIGQTAGEAEFEDASNGKSKYEPGLYQYKEYAADFRGYYMADYVRPGSRRGNSLQGQNCNNQTETITGGNVPFLAMFTRNKKNKIDPPSNVTQIMCTPFYYKQDVEGTVDARTRLPLKVKAKGPKQKLPADMWFSYTLDYEMNRGESAVVLNRKGALPLRHWPDQREQLADTQLSAVDFNTALSPMAGLAVKAGGHALEDLLKPEALKDSYEKAYRILFSRSMVEILDKNFLKTQPGTGTKTYATGVIVAVPVFVYIVQGLLGFISICALFLMIISTRRKWNIYSDPATIASIMSLVADSPDLLEKFRQLDSESMEEFERYLREKSFGLDCNEHGAA